MLNIPIGHKSAVKRIGDDRKFRAEIEEANKNGDCIINVGNGYYRPNPKDPIDCAEFEEYCNKELSRARTIQFKRLMMKKAFELLSHNTK